MIEKFFVENQEMIMHFLRQFENPGAPYNIRDWIMLVHFEM